MSRSMWATALAACAVALVLFTAALLPGVALAAAGHNASSGTHHPVLLGPGSGYQTPSGAVRSLQAKLTTDGFSPGPVDGRFGPLTRAAVARFQRADGLAVDGIVGPHTRHGLAAGGLLPGAGSIWPANRVRRLQRRLARSGFSPGRADGRYGPRTRAAVKRFQHARHLPASGIASAATLRALTNRSRRPHPAPGSAREAEGPAAPGRGQAPAGTHPHQPSTRPGRPSISPRASRGRSCCWLGALLFGALAMLALRGRARKPGRRIPAEQTATPQVYEPPAGQSAAVDADPGPDPEPELVSSVIAGAAADPTSSAAQIAALEAAVAMPSAGSPRNQEVHTTPDTPAELAVDQTEPPEERVERVKALQRQLTWLGFHPGIVDGRYGPLTTDAVREFQRVRNLPSDGVADAATLTALRAGTPDRPFSGRVQRVKELQRELTRRGLRTRSDRRTLRAADDRCGQTLPARQTPPRGRGRRPGHPRRAARPHHHPAVLTTRRPRQRTPTPTHSARPPTRTHRRALRADDDRRGQALSARP